MSESQVPDRGALLRWLRANDALKEISRGLEVVELVTGLSAPDHGHVFGGDVERNLQSVQLSRDGADTVLTDCPLSLRDSVVVAVEPVAEELIQKASNRTRTLVVGNDRRSCDRATTSRWLDPRHGGIDLPVAQN